MSETLIKNVGPYVKTFDDSIILTPRAKFLLGFLLYLPPPSYKTGHHVTQSGDGQSYTDFAMSRDPGT